MELNVRYTGGVSFEAETRGHRLDLRPAPGEWRQDSGMTPPELLAFFFRYVRRILRARLT